MNNGLITSVLIASLVVTLSMAACSQGPGQPGISNSTGGTLLGGAAGGVIGSNIGKGKGKTAATIGGALLGGLAGNSVGSSLDRSNANYNSTAPYAAAGNNNLQYVLENIPTGQTYGNITVTNTYNSNGFNCRDYVIGSQNGNSSGSACRQGNGVWVAR